MAAIWYSSTHAPDSKDRTYNRLRMKNDKKKEISRRFSKASITYDEFALVQKTCARELVGLLPSQIHLRSILEIGCGTGNYTNLLKKRFPQAQIDALDFAPGMVALAQEKIGQDSTVHFFCEDGEKFLADNRRSYDLITSNATMQWFDNLEAAFARIAASLTSQGMLHASFFGPQTLQELGQGLRELFDEPVRLAAAQFLGKEEIAAMAERCFSQLSVVETCYKKRYSSLRDVLQYIRKTGTGGYHQSLPVLTPGKLKKLSAWFVEHGGFEVSYQVFFISAMKKEQ